MQHDVLLHFRAIFLYWNQAEIWKKYSVFQSFFIFYPYGKQCCFSALELFHCLLLWKTVLFVSSRAFSLSTPTFFVVYPRGKQWGYMEKSYKMQQTLVFISFWYNISFRDWIRVMYDSGLNTVIIMFCLLLFSSLIKNLQQLSI